MAVMPCRFVQHISRPEQLSEVVKCGRPATGMPYHDRFAYTDKRCYAHTREEMGQGYAASRQTIFLSQREGRRCGQISIRQGGRTRAGNV